MLSPPVFLSYFSQNTDKLETCSHDHFTPSFTALNSFLSSPGQRSTAFQLAHNTSGGIYDMQQAHPEMARAFQNYLQLEHSYLPSWLNVVDFQSEFAENTCTDTVLFVDVGGGNGQQCVNLLTEYPNMKGRVILQDTPSVVQDAHPHNRVERMGYDYFTEQPVKCEMRYPWKRRRGLWLTDIPHRLTLQVQRLITSDKSFTTTMTTRAFAFSRLLFLP